MKLFPITDNPQKRAENLASEIIEMLVYGEGSLHEYLTSELRRIGCKKLQGSGPAQRLFEEVEDGLAKLVAHERRRARASS